MAATTHSHARDIVTELDLCPHVVQAGSAGGRGARRLHTGVHVGEAGRGSRAGQQQQQRPQESRHSGFSCGIPLSHAHVPQRGIKSRAGGHLQPRPRHRGLQRAGYSSPPGEPGENQGGRKAGAAGPASGRGTGALGEAWVWAVQAGALLLPRAPSYRLGDLKGEAHGSGPMWQV